jgi:hypothetical protein
MGTQSFGSKVLRWLKRIGLAIVALVVAVLVVLLLIDGTFLPKRYLKPWDLSYVRKIDDPRIQVTAHGLLAPNAHNTQPWKISLDNVNALVFSLFVDSSRLLPHSDPFSRQITMSQGTFLENVTIGAARLGYRTHIEIFPDGEFDEKGTVASIDAHPVARVTLEKTNSENHPLYDSITRATSKSHVAKEQLASDVVAHLQSINSDPDLMVVIFYEENEVAKLRQLTIDAMLIDMRTNLSKESDHFRMNEWQKNKRRDGLTLGAFGYPPVQQFFMQSMGSLITMSEEAMIEMGVEGFSSVVLTTPAYLMILSRGNSRTVQVKAGMLYCRLEHVATSRGLITQPAEQVLQEYPEMKELYQKVHAAYAEPDQIIQMLAGIGKPAKKVGRSPRRDVMDLIVK